MDDVDRLKRPCYTSLMPRQVAAAHPGSLRKELSHDDENC